MIKCDDKETIIKGTGLDLMVEFANITRQLVKGGCPKKLLDVSYEMAFKTEAELKAEFLSDVAPKIINGLSEMIKRCQEDSNED